MIKQLIILVSVIIFPTVSVFAQLPDPTPKITKKSNLGSAKTSPTSAKSSKNTPQNDKEAVEKALAITDLTERLNALVKFTTDYPNSTELVRVKEKIVSLRAQLADEKLRNNDTKAGIELFKQAVYDVPIPISESLFADVVLQFPTNLFYQGQQSAAIEVAKLIEEKISDNPKQLLGLATFYLGTEKAGEGQRLAQKAIDLNETLSVDAQQKVAAYQTLGLATRLSFQLDESEKAYTKALELNPESAVSKRSLAETKRALGKADEAIILYRELIEKDANDSSSQNGLILSLFDDGQQIEAETALNKSLEANPNNLFLLVGAAYWYAGQKNGDKAVEYAVKATTIEPRYTWAHIALARGFLLQNRPLDAEKTLLFARQYGKFPTLSYELATARISAGFFEEAANEVWKVFVIKDEVISTNLAGRMRQEGKDFIELLNLERRSAIFESKSADTPENAERIKNLLYFYQMLASKTVSEDEVNQSVEAFIKGNDNMRTHRQIYAANQLLLEKKSLPKVLELMQDAVKGVDNSLNVINPSAAVLADELLESRVLASSRNEVIIVPEIPRQTLSNIVRGRIEEISGWTLFQQGKIVEAIPRLKSAVSIYPEKSAWSRSSLWRLGVAYETNGDSKLALDNYIKSYTTSVPDGIKWTTIENLYRKINGNTNDLEKLIGGNPNGSTNARTNPTPITPIVTPTVAATPENTSIPIGLPIATPTPTPKGEVKLETKTEATPIPTPISTPEIKTEATPTVKTTPVPVSEVKSETEKTSETGKVNSPTKPLFEPIIITVPKSEVPNSNTKPTEKPANETVSENTRPRVANENNGETNSTENVETPTCLVASQDSVSILNQGGNLGILLGYADEGELSKITFEIDKPNDISVSIEPDIGKQSKRAFFIIKSISTNKGTYTVTFISPCGKKEVSVKVR